MCTLPVTRPMQTTSPPLHRRDRNQEHFGLGGGWYVEPIDKHIIKAYNNMIIVLLKRPIRELGHHIHVHTRTASLYSLEVCIESILVS